MGAAMEEIKKEAVYLEDGRKADKIVQEKLGVVNGETQVVTEVWAEPKIEKKLTHRVVEHKRPIIHKREIEVVDENGEVVEKRIESLEPEVKMQLREHIQSETQVAAQSVGKEDCDCLVTQEEMKKAFTEGFVTIAKLLKPDQSEAYEDTKVSAMQVMVGEKLEAEAAAPNKMGMILWGTIATLAAILVYAFVLM